jgi:hypothetical protein
MQEILARIRVRKSGSARSSRPETYGCVPMSARLRNSDELDFHPTVDTAGPARISSIARLGNGCYDSKIGMNGQVQHVMPGGEGKDI